MKKPGIIGALPIRHITVLLAEDQTSFRRSMKILVESDGDIEVVGEAKNGSEAVHLTLSLRPEVIVMDIAMPFLNGLQATQQLRGAFSPARVLILSAHPDPEYMTQAVKWGASGYLLKQSSTQVLAQAIREVLKGNSYFSPSISPRLRDQCEKLFGREERRKRRARPLALAGEQSPHHQAFPRRSAGREG